MTTKKYNRIPEGGYGYVSVEVMTDPNISIKAKAVYGYIRSCDSDQNQPTLGDIARDMGVKTHLLKKYIKELEDNGCIARGSVK